MKVDIFLHPPVGRNPYGSSVSPPPGQKANHLLCQKRIRCLRRSFSSRTGLPTPRSTSLWTPERTSHSDRVARSSDRSGRQGWSMMGGEPRSARVFVLQHGLLVITRALTSAELHAGVLEDLPARPLQQ